ncbi:hypothetical protein A4D02_23855 [Niastella koreensis]|uniref:Protein FecR C-terminal domain-containing protein n=2 Tax=Niastella koreensis TaxID=354356 RepID=G8TC58_NIAKG|nr:DUF4974 domain-containing protein [Niastella koreensis]AEW00365.1 hypothetical protein Niako_4086 [Niastella koreensis GR20-10]OQP52232.1 hypothetical protein A4D02_23855 [Niastella koreensis]
MDKKKLHINEAGSNSYPEPDVPVQAAWDNMQQLLLQAPAVPARASGLKKWLGKGMGKMMIGAGVVVMVSVITVMALKKNEQKAVTPVTHYSDSMVASQPVIARDTLIRVAKEERASIEFRKTPFKQVADSIGKAFDVKVILKGNIGDCTFTTRFDNNSLKEMLTVITYTFSFRYKIDKVNKQVTITGNGCN